ncbi:MAG: dihydroorotate dehydrogenase electron transfer subunit [Actinomycetota bacterium]|nr:dihydroorotate dehydrogenase electron transfer subunit [Actinomycetota bacterium]
MTAALPATAAFPARVLAPLGARLVTVTSRTELGPYVVLAGTDPAGPRPQAGQFYMLRAQTRWGGGESERPYLPRAFSVLRATGSGSACELELEFLLEDVGPGTRRLAELAPEDRLSVVGPLGQGFAAPRADRRALLVGGGVGIAPLVIWRDELGLDAPVLLGFRSAAHAAGAQLLREARVATDDGSEGHHGLVTDLLADALATGGQYEVYACGPPPMLEAVRRLCTERDVPAQLALESGMACGFGACFGCAVPTARGLIRLCLEGPVLDAQELGPEAFAVPGVGHR